MDLPWKAHFGITCSCGKAWAVELLTQEAIDTAKKDPVLALRALADDDKADAAAFYSEHKKMGHSPEPSVIGLAPLPKS
jgi:hypothetical protein